MMPSVTSCKTIIVKGEYGRDEEGPLAVGGLPGMNVNMTNAADAHQRQTYTPGATPVGGTAAEAAGGGVKVLIEDSLQGRTVNDAYAAGETAFMYTPIPGDVVQVLVATGQTIAKGDVGWAISSGKWNGAAASINAVGKFMDSSGGALAADTLMRLRVY